MSDEIPEAPIDVTGRYPMVLTAGASCTRQGFQACTAAECDDFEAGRAGVAGMKETGTYHLAGPDAPQLTLFLTTSAGDAIFTASRYSVTVEEEDLEGTGRVSASGSVSEVIFNGRRVADFRFWFAGTCKK